MINQAPPPRTTTAPAIGMIGRLELLPVVAVELSLGVGFAFGV
jgi:hypothetical protein